MKNGCYVIFLVEGCFVNLGCVIGYSFFVMLCSFINQVFVQIMFFKNNDEVFVKKYVEFVKSGKFEKKVYVFFKIFDEEVVCFYLDYVNVEFEIFINVQVEYFGFDVEGFYKSDYYCY